MFPLLALDTGMDKAADIDALFYKFGIKEYDLAIILTFCEV